MIAATIVVERDMLVLVPQAATTPPQRFRQLLHFSHIRNVARIDGQFSCARLIALPPLLAYAGCRPKTRTYDSLRFDAARSADARVHMQDWQFPRHHPTQQCQCPERGKIPVSSDSTHEPSNDRLFFIDPPLTCSTSHT